MAEQLTHDANTPLTPRTIVNPPMGSPHLMGRGWTRTTTRRGGRGCRSHESLHKEMAMLRGESCGPQLSGDEQHSFEKYKN